MKNNRKDDKLVITNALEMDKVACSMVALLLFFNDPNFQGKAAMGGTLTDSDKY
jgi:hypothetical protein